MKRIRSVTQAVEEIKKADPATPISKWMLRDWIARGLIPTVQTGTRTCYIDMDKLEAFLGGRPTA